MYKFYTVDTGDTVIRSHWCVKKDRIHAHKIRACKCHTCINQLQQTDPNTAAWLLYIVWDSHCYVCAYEQMEWYKLSFLSAITILKQMLNLITDFLKYCRVKILNSFERIFILNFIFAIMSWENFSISIDLFHIINQ